MQGEKHACFQSLLLKKMLVVLFYSIMYPTVLYSNILILFTLMKCFTLINKQK